MPKIPPPPSRIARRGTSRGINRNILLSLVRAHQPISRADLARLMGTTRAAVTLLVNDLLAEGLLYEGATKETARGRRPTFLHIDTRRRTVLAVDIRSTTTSLVLTDFLAEPLVPVVTVPTDANVGRFVKTVAARVRTMLERHRDLGRCEGLGVSVPGLVDASGERVLVAPGLGWHDVGLGEMLASACRRPVLMESAGRACALAQVWRPRDHSLDHIAIVSLSDDLAVGAIVGGQLLRGMRNRAGEFGHLPIGVDGPACACGARGCWEACVSNRATLARYAGRSAATRPRGRGPRGSRDAPTIDDLVSRARAGDRKAIGALRTTARDLGLGLASIVTAIDPARIYLDGEIFAAWDLIEQPVREALATRVLTQETDPIALVTLPPSDRPRLRGAAALVAAYALATPGA